VNELVETAYSLEDEVGVSLGPVVVNGLYPALRGLDADPVAAAEAAGVTLGAGEGATLAAAARFRERRLDLQREQVARLGERLPLPQIPLPYLFSTDLGLPAVDLLADAVVSGIEQLKGLPGGGGLA
jgi:hypothetical protein